MTACILDASVAVKAFLPVDGHAQALAVLDRFDLMAPGLVLTETANGFWTYLRRGEISLIDMRLSLRTLAKAIDIRPEQDLVEDALALATDLDHPVYDCLYLVLARREGLPLVTADRRLLKLARDRLGLDAIDLADIPAEGGPP